MQRVQKLNNIIHKYFFVEGQANCQFFSWYGYLRILLCIKRTELKSCVLYTWQVLSFITLPYNMELKLYNVHFFDKLCVFRKCIIYMYSLKYTLIAVWSHLTEGHIKEERFTRNRLEPRWELSQRSTCLLLRINQLWILVVLVQTLLQNLIYKYIYNGYYWSKRSSKI